MKALFLSICVAALGAPTLLATEPIIQFNDHHLVIEQVTPFRDVALFSISRGSDGWAETVAHLAELLTDSDGDGVVELDLEQGLERKSVWLAVDVWTGGYSIATPGDFELREVFIDVGSSVPGGPDGLFQRLIVRRESLDTLIVRPHVGAWIVRATEGGRSDDDGVNNREIRVRLDDAISLSGSGPPFHHLSANDVVVAIDPRRMEFFAFRFNEGP